MISVKCVQNNQEVNLLQSIVNKAQKIIKSMISLIKIKGIHNNVIIK